MKKGVLCMGVLLLLLPAFGQQKALIDLLQLKQSITGDFDNQQQSLADTSFLLSSQHIRQVWAKRKDGYWLYAEESVQTGTQIDIKQRFWHLYVQDDSTLVCQAFDLKEPAVYAGWWKTPIRFDSVKFTALSNRVGCELYLRKLKAGVYAGATDGKDCVGTLNNGTYTTTEMTIEKTGFSVSEKKWNADEVLVGGTIKGPYRYKRILRK